MDIEDQKFMAFEGIQSWARATITQVARIEISSARQRAQGEERFNATRQFMADRHLFLIAAFKLTECIEWAKDLNFLDSGMFTEIDALAADIKAMRDLNEHALEYFIGKGRFPEKWRHVAEGGVVDASSTVNDRIGNRVSWNEVAVAAKRLLAKLPDYYWPKGD
jgi:hypothetical protein